MKTSILAAMVPGTQVIGKDNDIPWKLSSDLIYFRKLTSGNPVIMGRKTYDSIGRPLPKRTNIVLSRNLSLKIEGCQVVDEMSQAIKASKDTGTDECFIIGGSKIFEMGMTFADRLYLTFVLGKFDGDVRFPYIYGNWEMTSIENHKADEKNECDYSFAVFDRKA